MNRAIVALITFVLVCSVALTAAPLAESSVDGGEDSMPVNSIARDGPDSAASIAVQALDQTIASGKGMWIWTLSSVEGGNASAIAARLASAGVDWVTIKAGDSNLFWTGANELTAGVVSTLHDAGILVFGWQYVYSYDLYGVPGVSEADVANQILDIPGIDGLIVDAEDEYKGHSTEATQYMQAIRAEHPGSFVAYAPFPIIDNHTTFPYLEFGEYCDAAMPQAYWGEIGVGPVEMVDSMSAQWEKWHGIWQGGGHGDSVKPVIPIGQSYDVPASEITQFCNAAKSKGYEGMSLYRYGLTPDPVWAAYGEIDWPSTECVPMVATGGGHTVGLRSDGTVVATGDNGYGQLNLGNWTDIRQVTAGYQHTVGLRSNGTVVATGGNGYGQCGVGSWTDIQQVATGPHHTVGLRSDGTAVAVGSNSLGQCDVGSWTDIQQVAGCWHTAGLRSDGTVVAVGYNGYGQCDVGSWTDVQQVSAGGGHTVGLRSDGTVIAVGYNGYGQCDVGSWTDVQQVSAGIDHTVGLRSDGTVVAAGGNGSGQCDIGSWTDIQQVAAGLYCTLGLKSDGTVAAVGSNSSGQCEVGDWDLTPAAQATIETQLSSIGDHLVRVWSADDNCWFMYDPADPVGSRLASLADGHGYWLSVASACTLDNGAYSWDLTPGWNLMGWLSYDYSSCNPEASISDQVNTIASQLVRVWGYHPSLGWQIYDPADPIGSDLVEMVEGRGYWFLVSEDCSMHFCGVVWHLSTGWDLMGWIDGGDDAIDFGDGMDSTNMPCRYYGTVQADGADVPDGTVITATVGGDSYQTTTPSIYGNSTYELQIVPPAGTNYTPGATVTFALGNHAAAETGLWGSGGNIELNLSATGPSLVLDSASEPPRGVLTIKGWGFTAGDTIPSGGIEIGGWDCNWFPINIDGCGRFTATLDVPLWLDAGEHPVTVATLGSDVATGALMVTPPALDLSPSWGPPGTYTVVSGCNMTQSSIIPIGGLTFGGAGWNTEPITVDSLGQIAPTTMVVPPASAGTYVVTANDLGGAELSGTFDVTESTANQLASIMSSLVIVWGYTAPEWEMYHPADPAGSNLLSLLPGRGYWLNVIDDCTLVHGNNSYDLYMGWNVIGWQDGEDSIANEVSEPTDQGLTLPCRYHGLVQIDGADVSDGTVILASIEGDTYCATTPAVYGNSTYMLEIWTLEPVHYAEGATITFIVAGSDAHQTGNWTTGGNIELDLTVAEPGDANGDGDINMQDVTYTELIILGYMGTTPGADANRDSDVNMGDVTTIELMILGYL